MDMIMPPTDACVKDIETRVVELIGASDNISLDILIRQGLPLSSLDKLAPFGLSAMELGIISKNALRHRLSQGKSLTPDEGDKLYRACLATLLTTTIFGNQQKSRGWLLKPRKAFGGRTALEATATTPGYNAVVTLLERLRHGYAA